MNPLFVFLSVAHAQRSFVDASLVCALLELGAADAPSKTSNGNLRRRSLPDSVVSKSGLHRASTRLVADGMLSASVYKNTRTTFSVNTDWLDEALEAAPAIDADDAEKVVNAMHQLQDYDASLMLKLLREAPVDRIQSLKLAELVEPISSRIDRHRARRAVYRLAEQGLVTLAPKARSSLGITLVVDAIDALLAKPLPNVRYLRPDAFSSQPYFVARAARLATALADDPSVELRASATDDSDVDVPAGPHVHVDQAGVVGGSAPRS